MGRKIVGVENQTGQGKKVCTLTGGTLIYPGMQLGPDGNNWEELTDGEVAGLTKEVKTFRHISKVAIDHLCAQKSRWAFTVFDSSLPHAVAFLHIRAPKKLDMLAGDDGNGATVVNEFTGPELLEAFNRADVGSRAPRVWRRNVASWDEIAINFCVKKL